MYRSPPGPWGPPRTRLLLTLLAAALFLAACASRPQAAAPPPPKPAPLDASYDWHVLMVAPFGSLLKSVPLALHEVLLFRDEAHNATPAEDLDCYAVNAAPPRFLDKSPEQYLLCFRYDRLWRIEATVLLPLPQAAKILSDACGLWMRSAATATPPSESSCQGTDRAISYGASLGEADQNEQLLTVRLNAIPQD